MQISSRNDNKLGQALTPAVEEALKISIARNPQPLSDALFPVMGPSIRKAIQSSIATMLQSMNQTLEHSFSAQGLRWRLDAIRTGKSFAEVVLLNTLVYRVEQVFLIHKETGLLLKHIALDPSHHEDADVVSSMLTAVQDFIHDSFSGSENQGIESLRMGDLQVLIEQGPDIVLALVCRGNPPLSLREKMQTTIEDIQHDFHENLQDFTGDTQTFEATDLNLSPLLVADYQSKTKKGSPFKPLIILGILAALITTWAIWDYRQQAAIDAQWQAYTQQLMDESGIVITSHSNHDGKHIIQGLRDPLSRDPYKLLANANLPPEHLTLNLQPYQSLASPFVLKRALAILQPPQSIILSLQGNTLVLNGSAAQTWLDKAKKTAPLIAGISQVDTSQLTPQLTLMERIQALLRPSADVQLSLNEHTLTVSGKATQAWAERAKKNIQNIKEITQYQDRKLTLVDSPAYILKQAYKMLRPPVSVRLFITKDTQLIAKGSASDTWMLKARQQAKRIAFLKSYNDQQLTLSDNIILQRAIEALQPPETVLLSLSNGILLATGEAQQMWIEQANDKATNLEGIDRFDNQVAKLIDEAAILAAAIKQLQPPSSVSLSFANGILTATGSATGAWISSAQDQFVLVDGVHSFYTNNLKNTTEGWTNIQRTINQSSITFPNSIAKISPDIQQNIATVASQFKQAQRIEPNSKLLIKALYSNNAMFITSLRLKSVQKELLNHGVNKKYVQVISHKTDAINAAETIHFALEIETNKP
ncbi:MAG: hypothetical protein L3J61_00955 [Ghiorsea sp.]|nr:hypothetical protein [Ghiorsea sp.]